MCLTQFSFIFKAIDFDIGDNNNVSYTVIENSDSNKIFQIDRKTGWIISAKSFVGRVGQHFKLKILAEDNDGRQPNFNDTAVANV